MIPLLPQSKQEFRKHAKLRLGKIPQTVAKTRIIITKLLELPQLHSSRQILTYYPLDKEVDLSELTQILIKMGKEVFLPFFQKTGIGKYSRSLHFNSKVNAYEPLAPALNVEPDLVIIPGLAFDSAGYRLGRGQGWYDRYLQKLDSIKIAVCYDELIYAQLPHEAHDILVDILISPKKILSFPRL